jgi:hypothetical protein
MSTTSRTVMHSRLQPLFATLAPGFPFASAPVASLYRVNALEREIAEKPKIAEISDVVGFLRERKWVADTLFSLGLGVTDSRAVACAMLRNNSATAAKVAGGRPFGFKGEF